MSDAVAEALTAATTPAPEAIVAEPAIAPIEPVEKTDDEIAGDVFDRLTTQNGAERGTDGKFVAKDGKQPEAGAGQPAGEQPAAEQPAEAVTAPANWQGLEDVWKAIPAEHAEKVKAHFDDLHRRMSDQGRQLAGIKPVSDQLAQAAKSLPQLANMAPDQIAREAIQLAVIQKQLTENPVETLLQVAHRYGAIPGLVQKLSGQEMPEGAQQISGLQREIADLKQKLQEASNPEQIETHVSRALEARTAQDAVKSFAADPANDLWPILEPHLPAHVAEIMQANPGLPADQVLRKAYDKALDAFPALKQAKAAAKPAAVTDLDQKRAEAAKKAASVNVKSTSTGKERQLSDEEAMAAAYDRAIAS